MIKITVVKSENNLPELPKAIKAGSKIALEEAGKHIVELIKQKIMSNVPPPLAEATIKRKGSDRTLIDTGAMLSQVSSEVVSDTEVKAGVIGDRADIAKFQEFGTSTIPERSFIRSSLEEGKGEIDTILKEKLDAEIQKIMVK
jgi:HK97 gp10 family phage protein